MFDFVSHRKIFFSISGVLILVSILGLIFFGLRSGIDFTGGSIMQIEYADKIPTPETIKQNLSSLNLGQLKIQATGKQDYIIRFKHIDENTHQKILTALGHIKEIRFNSIGPALGKELSKKAQWAVLLALIAIILYVAWAFRKLSKILKKGESWRYGAGALLALFHDVLILIGFFAFMGHFKGVEINAGFITAILTVLGYSVNDTIVIYDRIRENLLSHSYKTMDQAINMSVNETIARSLNTSLTTLFVLLVIYLFGGASVQNFVLAIMVGIGVGTYSSIAIASQFLLFKRKK